MGNHGKSLWKLVFVFWIFFSCFFFHFVFVESPCYAPWLGILTVAGHFLQKKIISSPQKMVQRELMQFSKSVLMSREFPCVSVCLLSRLFRILSLIQRIPTTPWSKIPRFLCSIRPWLLQRLLQHIPTQYTNIIKYKYKHIYIYIYIYI